jgi:hypothetical protein
VPLEALLRDPVRRERSRRAVQTRCGHAPGADGAAPAGEVVAIDPDQTPLHFVLWQGFYEQWTVSSW